MKHTLSYLFILGALCGVNNSFAYSWTFSNHTNKAIVLKFKFYASNSLYYSIVQPDKSVQLSWRAGNAKAGFCMEHVQWAFYNPSLPHRGGLALMQGENVDNATFDTLGYKLQTAEIVYLPDAIYNETIIEAENIGRGFDDILCGLVGSKAATSKMRISKVQEPLIQKAVDKLQTLDLKHVREVLNNVTTKRVDWIESVIGEKESARSAQVDKIQKELQNILTSVSYKFGQHGVLSPVPEVVYARCVHTMLSENEKIKGEKILPVMDLLLSSGTPLEFERKTEGWCRGPLSEVIAWFGGIIGKSSCKDRNFEIYDLKGKITFITRAN
jgi:hypothetical protein